MCNIFLSHTICIFIGLAALVGIVGCYFSYQVDKAAMYSRKVNRIINLYMNDKIDLNEVIIRMNKL